MRGRKKKKGGREREKKKRYEVCAGANSWSKYLHSPRQLHSSSLLLLCVSFTWARLTIKYLFLPHQTLSRTVIGKEKTLSRTVIGKESYAPQRISCTTRT